MDKITIVLETDYPLAADSKDPLYPLGTINDNYSNTAFIKEPFHFDLITAWEVVEHIYPDRLTQFFENIRRHLRLGGQFLAGICGAHSEVGGPVHHHSVFSKEHWKSQILNQLYGLKLCDYLYKNKVHHAWSSRYIMLETVA